MQHVKRYIIPAFTSHLVMHLNSWSEAGHQGGCCVWHHSVLPLSPRCSLQPATHAYNLENHAVLMHMHCQTYLACRHIFPGLRAKLQNLE